MDAKIDYLSFTVLVDCFTGAGDEADARAAAAALQERHPIWWTEVFEAGVWHAGGSRKRYASSWREAETITNVWYSGSSGHVLVEMPGVACQRARDRGSLDRIIAECAHRLTRLDCAVDFPGGASPREFVDAGHNQRFKSGAIMFSAEGDTIYVGGLKSERYARVYRYAPPHPRAGITRVEHVLRSDFAKNAGLMHVERGLLALAAACGESWGWKHASWNPAALDSGRLRSTRADRHAPGRVRWLHQVVIPALLKADAEGLLTLDELVERLYTLRMPVHTA